MAQNRNIQGISSVALAQILSGEKLPPAIPDAQKVSIEKCVGKKCYAFLSHDIPRANLPVTHRLEAFIPALEKDGLLFGVRLKYSNEWAASPYSLFAKSVVDGPAYQISERWVQNLAQLVKDALSLMFRILDRPFLHASATQPINEFSLDNITSARTRGEHLIQRWQGRKVDNYTAASFRENTKRNLRTTFLDEIAMRCRQSRGIHSFYSNSEAVTEWTISSEWGNWNIDGLSMESRLEELNYRIEPNISFVDFLRLVNKLDLEIAKIPKEDHIKSSNASRKKWMQELDLKRQSTSLWDENLINSLSKAWNDGREREEMLDWVNTVGVKESSDMIGRLRTEAYPDAVREMRIRRSRGAYASAFPAEKIKNTNIFIERYWWWREIYPVIDSYDSRTSNWTRLEISVFRDNWERSAFIYEMRARMSDRNHWDFFGKPWIYLTVLERAIISILWPPTRVGAYKFQSRSYVNPREDNTTEFEIKETVSLLASNGVIERMIAQLLKDARLRKGIPEPGNGKRGPTPSAWRALEFLDLDKYSTLIGLSGANRSSVKNAMTDYHKACKQIGIEP